MSGQWTLPIELREFSPEDYPRLAQVFGSMFPDYDRTPEEWKFDDDTLDKTKYYLKRHSCLIPQEKEPVGFAQIQNIPWMYHPKKHWIDVFVDPKHQRKGIGSALYERVVQDFGTLGTITSWAGVKEDVPSWIKFATDRGYREKMRAWESRLNPVTVNQTLFQKYVDKASERGIQYSTLAEERKTDPECLRKLHALVETIGEDIPRPEQFTPVSFDQWSAFEMKNPNLVP